MVNYNSNGLVKLSSFVSSHNSSLSFSLVCSLAFGIWKERNWKRENASGVGYKLLFAARDLGMRPSSC